MCAAKSKKFTKPRLALAVVASSVLSACGGGDGGGSTRTITTFTNSALLNAFFVQTFDAFETAASALVGSDVRYSVQTASGSFYKDMNSNGSFDSGIDVVLWGNPIRATGVHYAHAAGLTGAGKTIAISDEGFRDQHETVSGRVTGTTASLPQADHGTFVASVAAGSSGSMIGVAPGSNLLLGSWSNTDIISMSSMAQSANAVAWNHSWGYSGREANSSDFNAIFSGAGGTALLTAFRNYAANGVVVFALTNDVSDTSASLTAALPLFDSSLEDGWISVVNAVPQISGNDIVGATRISSACLESARWCITSDGSWTGASASSNTSYEFGTGSSYAAPMVSGALALLSQAFPTLTPHELRIRLLASADYNFAGFVADQTMEIVSGVSKPVSNEFGHGFLDVQAALMPIGIVTTVAADGNAVSLAEPIVISGNATGGAVREALSQVTLTGKDALSGGFTVNAGDLVAEREPDPIFAMRMVGDPSRDVNAGALDFAMFGRNPTISAGVEGLSLAMYAPQTDSSLETSGMSIGRSMKLGDDASIEWRFGVGQDRGRLLPTWQNGEPQHLASLGAAITADTGDQNWLELSGVVATATGRGSTAQSRDTLLTAAQVAFVQRNALAHNDQLRLSVQLPYAVSQGRTTIALPVTHANGQTAQSATVNLAPKSREVRIALDYNKAVGRHSALAVSLVHAENRGHVRGKTEDAIFLGFRTQF